MSCQLCNYEVSNRVIVDTQWYLIDFCSTCDALFIAVTPHIVEPTSEQDRRALEGLLRSACIKTYGENNYDFLEKHECFGYLHFNIAATPRIEKEKILTRDFQGLL